MKRPVLFWLLLAAGLVCCFVSLTRRAAAEHTDRAVAFAIAWEDAQALADAANQSVDPWLQALSAVGVQYLIGTDAAEPAARAAAEAAGMSFARAGDAAQAGDAFLLPASAYAVAAPNTVPVALVDNETRTGVNLPASFDPDAWSGPMVKTLYLYDAYAAGDTEGIIFRAVTERGLRLVVLTPLTENGVAIADPAAYAALPANLTPRLAARGLTVGERFTCLAAPRRSAPLLAGMALLPVALLALFCWLLFPAFFKPLYENLLLALGALAALGGAFLAPNLL